MLQWLYTCVARLLIFIGVMVKASYVNSGENITFVVTQLIL